jgi:preprotein translocase subunit YajC
MFWTSVAYAMGSPAGGAGGGDASAFASFIPLVLMFAVFYFLLIRPQQKRTKEHKAMLSALKRGDEVVTAGGLFGRITETAEDHVLVDLGNSVVVKVARSSISAVAGRTSPAVEKKTKKGEAKDAREGKERKSSDPEPPAEG